MNNKLKDTDEEELLNQLRQGDHAAFRAIYDLYADTLVYKLHKLIKIDTIVEELHQDTFMRLWNAREQLQENTQLKAFLFTIARNLAIDFYRKAAKDKELQRNLALHIQLDYDHIEPLLQQKETLLLLEELISKLPPQRQKIFRLIKMEGKSYEEAARHFDVSMSTIKDHMARSSQFLKQQLAQNYPHITFSLLAYIIFN
ncbi:RNA polymerase sigma factor [Sphingobacterium yanglingense]|uniref:RNA polymerase sigma-70 factor (ECF subfamily) n=1 Tax=Sphingobacterium yanglingense TaxID=1437280 RepID=A0A4R6WGM3_9SPHI|nr:RNA polymerase sigma factor [Sphingobacterium yanglingense]TDQ79254.1 RNA polymerase sigma-70 factor (ECF subfamily) [Sphingobacterium yanglingense]